MNKALKITWSRMIMFLSMLFLSATAMAQDKKVDVNINTKSESGFLTNPIVWVIGGAVFILLLVALLRNNRRA